MSPPEGERHRSDDHRTRVNQSGEHAAYVTQGQFGQFLGQFNEFSKDVKETLGDIKDRLASGSTTMTLMDSTVKRGEGRMQDHSDSIAVIRGDLRDEINARRIAEAAKQGAEAAAKPLGKLRETLIKTVVIVATTGGCALVWEKIIHTDPPAQPAQTNIMMTPAPVAPKPAGP